eukprot:2985900-Amphidinium_carterae.1
MRDKLQTMLILWVVFVICVLLSSGELLGRWRWCNFWFQLILSGWGTGVPAEHKPREFSGSGGAASKDCARSIPTRTCLADMLNGLYHSFKDHYPITLRTTMLTI